MQALQVLRCHRNEIDAGYPQGNAQVYQAHTRDRFFKCECPGFGLGHIIVLLRPGRWCGMLCPGTKDCVLSALIQWSRTKCTFCLSAQVASGSVRSAPFAGFGEYQQAARHMEHNAQGLREFLDQQPSLELAQCVFECMEYRRPDECDDWYPYFDHQLVGSNWQGQVIDTISSGPLRVDID